MKLTNLNQPITDFSGAALPVIEGTAFTVKTAILNCLGAMRAADGKEAIEVFTVGGLIAQGEDGCDLKADQFMLVQKAVESNAVQYTTLVLGQLLIYLQSQDCPPMDNPPEEAKR